MKIGQMKRSYKLIEDEQERRERRDDEGLQVVRKVKRKKKALE